MDDDAEDSQIGTFNLNSVIILNRDEKQEWGWDISKNIIEENITYRKDDNWLYRKLKISQRLKNYKIMKYALHEWVKNSVI